MGWKNFSFVIPKWLAGMSYPGYGSNLQENLNILKEKGISAIVSFTEETLSEDILFQNGFEYLHIPVQDFSVPTIEQAHQTVEFVNKMIKEKRGVVFHCYAGQGRTGTMLACYFVSLGIPAQDAIFQIRNLRPGSIETTEQERFIFLYEKNCPKKKIEFPEIKKDESPSK